MNGWIVPGKEDMFRDKLLSNVNLAQHSPQDFEKAFMIIGEHVWVREDGSSLYFKTRIKTAGSLLMKFDIFSLWSTR